MIYGLLQDSNTDSSKNFSLQNCGSALSRRKFRDLPLQHRV